MRSHVIPLAVLPYIRRGHTWRLNVWGYYQCDDCRASTRNPDAVSATCALVQRRCAQWHEYERWQHALAAMHDLIPF